LGREESERFRGKNVRRIREDTQRVRGVWGEEQILWRGSDEKAEAGIMFTVPLRVLFCPKPPTSSVLLPAQPEPFAYSPRSGARNQGRTGYHGKKGGGHGCVGEGWSEMSPGHKAPAKRSLETGALRARGGRGYALGAGSLGRTAPGQVLCLGTQRGRVQTNRVRALTSGTGVYVISARSVGRTGRTGRTRIQGNIFADATFQVANL